MNRNEVCWSYASPEKILVDANRYPDPHHLSFKAILGQWLELSPELLVVTAGGDHLIELFLLNCLLKNKKRIGIMTPSFECFQNFSKKIGLEVIPFELDANFDVDLPTWLAKMSTIDALILCTPNNPTGNLLNHVRIQKVIDSFKGDLLIDQAYLEFVTNFKNYDFKNLPLNRPHTLILRTFSKAFGLAGLRVGYGIASKDLKEQLDRLLGPYPISNYSISMAIESIKAWDQICLKIKFLKIKIELWRSFINQMNCGIYAFPTDSNFILLKINNFDHSLFKDPEIQMRLRRFSGDFGKKYTRMTIDLFLKDPT